MLLILIKAVLIYFLVLVCVRLTGKRQLGEMQPFELVIMLMIADLACIPINDPFVPFYGGVVPIIALTFLSIVISLIARKSIVARRLISGKAIIVIDKGSIVYPNLKKMNINIHDLLEATRTSGYPDINQIEYAIFENNGKIYIIEKTKDPTKIVPALLPLVLIVDGRLEKHNLEVLGLSQPQLEDVLKKSGIAAIKDVLYMDVRQDGTGYICPKNGQFFNQQLKVSGDW